MADRNGAPARLATRGREAARSRASSAGTRLADPLGDDAPRESATPAGSLWERAVEKLSAASGEIDPEQLEEPFVPASPRPGQAGRDRE